MEEKRPEDTLLSFAGLVRGFIAVAVLFGVGLYATHVYGMEIIEIIRGHEFLGFLAFFLSTVLAVVLPFFSNITIIPIATMMWGPVLTALSVLVGWAAGSTLTFFIARVFQDSLIASFPSLGRYTFVDKLIDQRRPFLSLVILRATFPVDILSYALGIFSTRVTLRDNLYTTLIGTLPFAILFSWFDTFPARTQGNLFVLTTIGFVVYVFYLAHLRRKIKDSSESGK